MTTTTTMTYRINQIESSDRWELTTEAIRLYQEGQMPAVVTVYVREQDVSAWSVDSEVNLREIVENW